MIPEDSLQEQIQQLALGRLAFEERASLLRNIDGEHPENWRTLALALVERDILREATFEESHVRPFAAKGAWLAAACVALGCFLLGWLSRPQDSRDTVAATAPATTVDSALEYPVPSATLVREANARLASTGYEASLLTRYVRTNLEGRVVVIPLSQLRLDYRGL